MTNLGKSFRKSIFNRYFATCSVILLATITLMGILIVGFSASYFRTSNQKNLRRRAEQAASITLASMEHYNYRMISASTLQTGFGIMAMNNDITVFLTDLEGKTLVCTDGGHCSHKTYVLPEEILDAAAEGEYTETGTMNGIYKRNYYTVGIPVEHDGTIFAYVFISTEASDIGFYVLDLMDIIIFGALIATAVSSVAIYIVTKKLTKPLSDMAKATKSFSSGDFTVRVPVEGEDEAAELAASFNRMADSLADMESVRRNFIANVSHELKTPMMTIGGFVDGILDGTVPKEKEHQYLETVSEEIKRLSRMVKSMLGVARMEARDLTLKLEDFNINELVIQTLFAFEQKIEAKNLEILGLDSDEVFVHADNDLIHQVVYNLIDNAIKFSNEGGCISFAYRSRNGKVFVSVRNTGAGLPQHELPRVFDRFYKTDKSRALDKTGVGLGLYIVQTIINQHKGDLIVQSVEGEYTEFTFSVDATDPKVLKERKKHRNPDEDKEKEPNL